MAVPKAIETVYGGYRFRSRLEARWGVFFDAVGSAWEYEPEGFIVDGAPYLPDFLLPKSEQYLEVKPQSCLDREGLGFVCDRYVRTLLSLSKDLRSESALLVGPPGPWGNSHKSGALVNITNTSCDGGYAFGGWGKWHICHHYVGLRVIQSSLGVCNYCGKQTDADDKQIMSAFASSRGHRFEHNERWRP